MSDELRAHRRPAVIRALYGNAEARATLRAAAEPLPEPLARWLGNLALLEGLPFNAIVADTRMLPQESIRFFYMDANWIDALVDGAYSVVEAFDAHHALTAELLRDHVHAQARKMARVERHRRRRARRRLSGEMPEPLDTAAPWTGFLMRSVAVQDWPGLTVRAFVDREGETAIDPLRIVRLSPTVLLAVFAGTAHRFDVAMPAGGLCFGVEAQIDADEPLLRVALRGLGGTIASGLPIEGHYADVALRADARGRRVLDVSATHASLAEALKSAYAPSPCPPLDPGAFAIEMTAGAKSQRFYNGAALAEHDGDA
jgi:hypothetical protein